MHTYVMMADLPECVEWQENMYKLRTTESFAGTIHVDETNTDTGCHSLMDALYQASVLYASVSITIGSTTLSYTMGLHREGIHLYLFDSHSRDHKGLASDDGHAILLEFPNLHDVTSHIKQLARCMGIGCDEFEIVPMGIESHVEGNQGGNTSEASLSQYFHDQTARKQNWMNDVTDTKKTSDIINVSTVSSHDPKLMREKACKWMKNRRKQFNETEYEKQLELHRCRKRRQRQFLTAEERGKIQEKH